MYIGMDATVGSRTARRNRFSARGARRREEVHDRRADRGPELTRRVGRALPAGRWGRPEDVARLVRWPVSDESAWITGQVIDSEAAAAAGSCDAPVTLRDG
ncbi:hypothetical protein GCM10023196_024670 [Actinoallomurus vinaceus]|uniref:SDR family oxidoreductase n=1 Tax=Actinoallomurus vinaceus TaxID=1080074 RepID=A0ABP8U8M5_9ACTN